MLPKDVATVTRIMVDEQALAVCHCIVQRIFKTQPGLFGDALAEMREFLLKASLDIIDNGAHPLNAENYAYPRTYILNMLTVTRYLEGTCNHNEYAYIHGLAYLLEETNDKYINDEQNLVWESTNAEANSNE